MLRRVVAFALLLLTSACSRQVDNTARPAATEIDRLEALLSRHPCVGHLNSWERNYRFAKKTGLFSEYSLNPDLDVVELHLRRVGTVTIGAGQNAMAPDPDGDWPDRRPIRSIDGKFTLTGSNLRLPRCRPVQSR